MPIRAVQQLLSNFYQMKALENMEKLWPWDKPEVQWAWDRADEIITKFNRMKRDVQADDVDLLKMIAEALVEAKGK